MRRPKGVLLPPIREALAARRSLSRVARRSVGGSTGAGRSAALHATGGGRLRRLARADGGGFLSAYGRGIFSTRSWTRHIYCFGTGSAGDSGKGVADPFLARPFAARTRHGCERGLPRTRCSAPVQCR